MKIGIEYIFEKAYQRTIANSKVKGNYTKTDVQRIRRAFVNTLVAEMRNHSIIDFGYMTLRPYIKQINNRKINAYNYILNKEKQKSNVNLFFNINKENTSI